ncbi:MAG TPA: hypothetical protein VL287_04985 [Gemmatimonadales bacterium]|jgi:hypothetical protein|nr:hypothetical protein [Gemmatimonadales bacterium]
MRTIAVATTLMLAWVGAAGAQQETGEVQSARADIHAARTKLVAANLPLTEEEGAKFWPLYNQYRGEVSKLNDRSLALIKDFAASYDSMSDEKASDLLKQQMAIDEDRLKLKKSYLGKFEKVLPQKKVARYYQIERKLDASVQYEAAKAIPLVK